MVRLAAGLLALGTSRTSIPSEWPAPRGKEAALTPDDKIASSEFHDPDPGVLGDLKMPRRWKPLTRVQWHKSAQHSNVNLVVEYQKKPAIKGSDEVKVKSKISQRIFCISNTSL
jgi:hypothetical protein